MKVLVVDDEAPARNRLLSLLGEVPGVTGVAEAHNGLAALREAERWQPDVVLLDIRMPEMDGIEAAHQLARTDKPPAVIFTTAYTEHALQAFEAHAVDYLVKPIRKERLIEALEHAARPTRAQLQELAGSRTEARKHLCARQRGELLLVPIEEVICLQADQKYVNVIHRGGRVLIEESLRELEREFGSRFLRIHRGTLVAVAQISGLVKDSAGRACMRLEGTDELYEVSRRHLSAVREFLRSGG